MSFEKRMGWIKKLSREELELKYEMCIERIETLDEEALRDGEELAKLRQAMTLISEGLGVLDSMATVARPSEHETLFKDYAPFNNIMASYFPKQKKSARPRAPNADVTGAAPNEQETKP